MKNTILVCDCSSKEHQIVITRDDKDNQIFFEIHLVKHNFLKRLWVAIKYIFGYSCKFGNFEEFILTEKDKEILINEISK